MQPTRRKPWLAALLSLALAGLGHLYAGSPRRAVAFFGGELVATIVLLYLPVSWPSEPWNVIVGAAVFAGWRFVTAASAFRVAARKPARTGRPAWIRWPAYAVVYLAAQLGTGHALRATGFEVIRIQGRSMSDTLINGDRLLATKWNFDSLERGGIVALRLTSGGETYVKRVIAMPGDRVELDAGIASVNGKPLAEPYVRHDGTDRGEYGPIVVPPASYFVLGDYRNMSKDSREFGFVREDQIFARPCAVFWSRDPDTAEIRWSRFGRPLR